MKAKRNFAIKLVCAALVMIVCTLCFISCNKNPDNDPAQTTPVPAEPITLVAGGQANVRIVYQSSGGSQVVKAMENLRDSMSEMSGVKVSAISDMLSDHKDEDLEILIGATDYAASKDAIGALAANSYSITVSGSKIVVAANNAYLYPLAVEELIASLKVADGVMTVDGGISKKSESYPVVSLAANKASEYTIVFGAGNAEGQTQANALKAAFRTAGVEIQISADTKSASGKEILVGKTNRALSKTDESYYLNSHIKYDESGNVAITGNLQAGVANLSTIINTLYAVNTNIDVPHFVFGHFAPVGYGMAPKYEGKGTVTVSENFEKFNSYYVQANGAGLSDFKAYCDKLTANGFSLYYNTESQDSKFATYTDGYNIVNVSYLEYEDPNAQYGDVSYVSIAIESTDSCALPPVGETYENVTTLQLTQVKGECAFIVRLTDGRFLVVDGGLDGCASTIYEQISAQNVLKGKPVIAAWIFTHPHTDHVAGFYTFAANYGSKVTLELVVHNFPGYDKYDDECNETPNNPSNNAQVVAGMKANSEAMYTNVKKYFGGAKFVIAHAGQRFEFAGLNLDVLWTHENLFNRKMFNTNMSSTVYSLQSQDMRVIILGDQYYDGCDILNAIYQDDLDADIVQLAHHGYNGGSKAMYDSIGASIAIWTNTWNIVNGTDNNGTKLYDRGSYNNIYIKNYDVHLIMGKNDKFMTLKPDMDVSDLQSFVRFN